MVFVDNQRGFFQEQRHHADSMGRRSLVRATMQIA
jgi:hypothetical protein